MNDIDELELERHGTWTRACDGAGAWIWAGACTWTWTGASAWTGARAWTGVVAWTPANNDKAIL